PLRAVAIADVEPGAVVEMKVTVRRPEPEARAEDSSRGQLIARAYAHRCDGTRRLPKHVDTAHERAGDEVLKPDVHGYVDAGERTVRFLGGGRTGCGQQQKHGKAERGHDRVLTLVWSLVRTPKLSAR